MKKLIFFFLVIFSLSLVLAGENCKTTQEGMWCCDNPSYVICGDTEVCGINDAWCDNYLNSDKSCNQDGSICCDNAGWIFDYFFDVCCPPDNPFYNENIEGCLEYRQISSVNYYTELSECYAPYGGSTPLQYLWESKCVEHDSYSCTPNKIDVFIDGWNIETVIGKCEVECLEESDCPVDVPLGEKYCENNNVVRDYRDYSCSDYICDYEDIQNVLEECDYKCEEGICIIETCEEGITKCVGNEVYICQDNQFEFKETCDRCEEGKCLKKTNWTLYISIGIIALFIISLITFFTIRRRR